MKPLAKIGLVGVGFIGALALASAVVAIHVAATSGPDRQTYGAMFDFGEGCIRRSFFATPICMSCLAFGRSPTRDVASGSG